MLARVIVYRDVVFEHVEYSTHSPWACGKSTADWPMMMMFITILYSLELAHSPDPLMIHSEVLAPILRE